MQHFFIYKGFIKLNRHVLSADSVLNTCQS